MEQLGIKFVAAQEGLDTSNAYGKLTVSLGSSPNLKGDRIRERVRDSQQYRVSQGFWPGGQPFLHGYRWLSDKQEWQTKEEEDEGLTCLGIGIR